MVNESFGDDGDHNVQPSPPTSIKVVLPDSEDLDMQLFARTHRHSLLVDDKQDLKHVFLWYCFENPGYCVRYPTVLLKNGKITGVFENYNPPKPVLLFHPFVTQYYQQHRLSFTLITITLFKISHYYNNTVCSRQRRCSTTTWYTLYWKLINNTV